MTGALQGRTALLSGAARMSGLGHAFSKGLASAGANIVIADVIDGSDAAARIEELGGRAISVVCDVSRQQDVHQLKEVVDREFGGCDIIVHCASPFPFHQFDEIDFNEWRHVLSIILDGMYLLATAFLPGMKQRGWGRIIPISSTAYLAGLGGWSHYVTSKAGLIGFTRSLAREVGNFGVTVNTIAPGLVRTEGTAASLLDNPALAGVDIYALQRERQSISHTLEPEDLVGPLLFLASDASAYVTGQMLIVDAGEQYAG